MKVLPSLLCLILFIPVLNYAQVRINEIQTTNKSIIADEDGDFEDWIEIYNQGSSKVNLDQFGLTDNPENPFKWKFPAVELEAGGHLLVFASGKDKTPLINHWETAVFADQIWKYFVGTEEPPYNWKAVNFPASGWSEGPGGIGYGDNDDGTQISATISVYMRLNFDIPDASAIGSAVLHMDYDDGFVAYLNGFEIGRSNLAGFPPAFDETTTADHEAQMYQGGYPDAFPVDSLLLQSILISGTNVLAIQTHNSGALSSDLSSIPFLSFGIKNSNTYFQPVPSWFPNYYGGALHTNFKLKHGGESIRLTSASGDSLDQAVVPFMDLDHSYCRIPDGNPNWCFANTPTPDNSNNASVCYAGYAAVPEIVTIPGFYESTVSVEIAAAPSGSVIRYTTNGNTPKDTDPIYTQPIPLNQTRVIKARTFGSSGWLPGETNTATFIIGEANPKLPVISISTDSSNLWDYFTGIYVMGPNADPNFPHFGANFWQPWEKDCHMEYFLPAENRKFALNAGLSIHGGWTRALDQKSFNIKTRPFYNHSEIHYPLFADRPFEDYTGLILRNSGNDWMNTYMRDALMQRIMKDTYVDYTVYCPSVTYVNGSYWGIYNIRERSNKDYVELNYGINSDSVDMIESDGIVAEGDANTFWEMVDFMTTHELSIPQNYAIADQWWDIPNLADYFIAETYYVNNDWIGDWTNNIKLWREKKSGAEWRYMLWDLDFGLGLSSDYTQDKLSVAMNPPTATPHADIFRGLLENSGFRQYFINRYADLINTLYQPQYMFAMVEDMKDSIAEEIPLQWLRWYGYLNSSEWEGYIQNMRNFISMRPAYARMYIKNAFNLEATIQVKLAVLPESSGEIKINTITPGPLPWIGSYFDGNPITLTALAKPGFKFEYWLPNSYISMNTSRTITVNLDHFDTFKAVFSGTAEDAKIVVSEVNYHPDSTLNGGDWLELHNYSEQSLDISDWVLNDSKHYHKFIFPVGTVIPSGSHLVVAEEPSRFHQQYPGTYCLGPLGFSLGNDKETLTLSDRHKSQIYSFTYNDSVNTLQAADGWGRTLELLDISGDPNDPNNWFTGCVGGSPGEAYHPCNDPVVISEINYNSADWADAGDWIELRNTTSAPFDLTGWVFSDSDPSHRFILPQGSIIPAGGQWVLPGNEAAFESQFPWVTNKTGPFNFGLSGSGEALRLYEPSGKLRFCVLYRDDNPWPTEPDGEGYTLELNDINGVMCDGNNWFAGCFQGSPGGPYVFPCHTGMPEEPAEQFLVFPNPAASTLYIISRRQIQDKADIQINDAYGRLVRRYSVRLSEVNPSRISLDGLKSGVYYLNIRVTDKAEEVHKVVVTLP